jgi:FixJ family two-component response regulator
MLITRARTTHASPPIVHVVEDDAQTRKATARFLRAAGYIVKTYAAAPEFLSPCANRTSGCVVLDLCLRGPNGLEVQQALAQRDHPLPVVFLSGHCGIPDAVRAMKQGAVDFLSKAVAGSVLLDAVSRALVQDAEGRAKRARLSERRARYERLSPREREVFAHLISGQLNKQIAFDLGISEQTVRIHRQRVLKKLEGNSIADLVRMAADLGVEPVGSDR